ncbi:MAG: DNA repair protein RadC [Lachnospiraceae bacterium]|nr:DNA repair protein RadC [Lachnospiraceae bacterium]
MKNILKIKDLPVNDRPYERCLKMGAEALSDVELLAVIIKNGTRGRSAMDLANELLHMSNDGLAGLNHLHVEELMRVEGIGTVKAVQIKCLCELGKRIVKADTSKRICFNSPETIARYYAPDLKHKESENLIMLALNTKSALIDEFLISKGTVNSSIASPREIFIEALKARAVSIILIHNHPSGDPTPSRDDKIVTRRIKEAGELVGISLIDHIIIGNNNYISFKEKGYL